MYPYRGRGVFRSSLVHLIYVSEHRGDPRELGGRTGEASVDLCEGVIRGHPACGSGDGRGRVRMGDCGKSLLLKKLHSYDLADSFESSLPLLSVFSRF